MKRKDNYILKGFCEEVIDMFWYGVILILLFGGFFLLFSRVRLLDMLLRLFRQTREGVDEAARRRLLANRRNLLALQREHSLWYSLEQELHYSGWKRHFPLLTAELWIMGNVVFGSVIFLIGLLLTKKWIWSFVIAGTALGIETAVLWICKIREIRSVNENLLKFLNFLGNYSITAGEVTGIFNQVSKYVDEPIKSALAECCYEAQTTGDAGQALLSMAEKIEHPKFKELARNMEVSIRYCADFSMLVDGSRRSVREYLRLGEERKGMLREAVINMLLLLAMSLFALVTVDGLIEASIWEILLHTLPGRVAMLILAVVFCLMARQLYKVQK